MDIAWALIERGVNDIKSSETGLGVSWRKRTAPTELSPPTHKRITKEMKLPVCRLAPGPHLPVHLDSRVHCFLCRWNLKNIDSKAEGGKTGVKCASCNEALCFTKE